MPRGKAVPRETSEAPTEQGFDFKKPFQQLKPESFWQFLQQYPNWEACAVYVYRLWPAIDRRLAGHKEKYIDVFSEPITELDLLRKHGSGKYQIHFNDSNRPKNLVNVATCKVEINDPMFDPVVPLEEVVEGADANKSYIEGLKARGKWKEGPVPATENGQATAEMARTLTNMVDRVMDRQAAPPPPAPQDPFVIAMQMLKLVPPPPPPPDPTGQAMKLLEFIRANEKPAQARDPLEVYAKVAEIIEARASRQAANPGNGTDWGGMVLGFLNALPQLMQGFMMMKAMVPQPAPAMAGPDGPAPPPILPEPTPFHPTGVTMPVSNQDISTLFAEMKPFLVKAIVQGQAGDEFAAGLVTFQGEERYRQLASYGMDGLLGALKSHVELWMMLSSYEDQVRTFIQEFLDYGKAEPEVVEGPTE
jgi:hypothetical protein